MIYGVRVKIQSRWQVVLSYYQQIQDTHKFICERSKFRTQQIQDTHSFRITTIYFVVVLELLLPASVSASNKVTPCLPCLVTFHDELRLTGQGARGSWR